MADAAPIEEEGKKKSGLLKWIIIGVALVALGGGGYFAYLKFFKAPPEQAPEAAAAPAAEGKAPPEAKAEPKKEEGGHGAKKEGEGGKPVSLLVPLDAFVVNLADPPPARRYMKVQISAEMVDEKASKELEAKKVFVRDAIILLLSSKTTQDLASMEGKLALRKELAEKINLILEGPKVVRVYFTELVIQ